MSVDVTRSPAAGAPMSRAEKLQLWRQNKADAGAFASAATKKGGKSQAAAKPVKDSVVVIEKTAPAPKPATRGAKAKAAPAPAAVAVPMEVVAPAPAPVEAAPQARSKRAARGAMVPKKAAVAVPKNVELVVVEPTPAPIAAAAAATPAPAAAFVPSTPAPTPAVAATNADAENTTVPGTPSFQMTASARKFGNNAANATWQPTHSKGATGKKPKTFVGVAIPPEPMVLVPAPTLMDAAGLQRALEAVQEKRLTEAGNLFAVEPLPEVKHMAKYWVARALIEEEYMNYEGVVKLFEQATECGAQPTAELDAALRAFVGRVKNKSDTVDPKDTVAVKAFALTGLSNAVSQLSQALKAHNLFTGPAPTPMEGVATSFGASTPRGKYFGDEQPTEASYAAVVEELLADSPEPAPEKIMAKPKLARTPVGAAALIRGVTGAGEASPALFKATNKLARTPTAAPAPPAATTTITVTPTGRRRSSTGSAPKSPVLLSMSAAKPTTPAGDASFNAYLLGNPSLDFEEGDLPSTPECPSLALSTNSLATPANTNQSFFATPSSSRAKMAMSGGPTRVPKSLNESVAAGFEFEAHPKPSEAPKPMTAIVLLQAVRTPASMRALAEGADEIITPVRRGTRATPKRDLTVADLETHPVYTYNKALNVEDFKDDATPSRPAKRARKSKGAASSVVDTVIEEAEAESVPTPLAATPVNTPARRSQRISRAATPA